MNIERRILKEKLDFNIPGWSISKIKRKGIERVTLQSPSGPAICIFHVRGFTYAIIVKNTTHSWTPFDTTFITDDPDLEKLCNPYTEEFKTFREELFNCKSFSKQKDKQARFVLPLYSLIKSSFHRQSKFHTKQMMFKTYEDVLRITYDPPRKKKKITSTKTFVKTFLSSLVGMTHSSIKLGNKGGDLQYVSEEKWIRSKYSQITSGMAWEYSIYTDDLTRKKLFLYSMIYPVMPDYNLDFLLNEKINLSWVHETAENLLRSIESFYFEKEGTIYKAPSLDFFFYYRFSGSFTLSFEEKPQ